MFKIFSSFVPAVILFGAAQLVASQVTATDLALHTTACALQNLAGIDCYATIF